MEKTVFDITLALGQSPARRLVTVKRYDSHCTLRLRLVSSGKPYPVTEDCYGVFTARKPDGTVIYNPCAREGNVFLYDLTPQTTAAVGELRCELKLYGPEEALLTSAAFLMEVADTVYSGDEELASSTEAEALTQMMENARQGIDQMQTVLQQADSLVRIEDAAVGKFAWSSQKLADTFCPAFTDTKPLVRGMLLEGYPLEITTVVQRTATELTLTVCGKNLFDFRSGVYEVNFVGNDGTLRNYKGYAIKLPVGTYAIHAERVASGTDYIYGVLCAADGSYKSGCNIVLGADLVKRVVTIEEGDILYIYNGLSQEASIAVGNEVFSHYNIQLEVGDTGTPYEPYRGQKWSADLSSFTSGFNDGAFYNWNTGVMTDEVGEYWQHDPESGQFFSIADIDSYVSQTIRTLPAQAGENFIYGSAGTLTVRGRQELSALLEKLTAAL